MTLGLNIKSYNKISEPIATTYIYEIYCAKHKVQLAL